ncbi:MAG: hypothetical protein QOI50_3780, partial [Pseudonocardiales bacterium]|nr:hypothetical protein [Pseudonocardiales bacterium]
PVGADLDRRGHGRPGRGRGHRPHGAGVGRDAVQPDGGVLVPLESTIIGDWYYPWYRAEMHLD